MGNSLGGLKSYMDLLDRYEMYQGGYIWDFIDQALFVKDEVTGREVLRYGGDFDDRPSDYEFSGNGIVFADQMCIRYRYWPHRSNRSKFYMGGSENEKKMDCSGNGMHDVHGYGVGRELQ